MIHDLTKLRVIVAEMRALGITGSFKINLGVPPIQQDIGGSTAPGEGPAPQEEAAQAELPAAFKRLPLAYQNPTLYGGKLPKLDG